MSEYEAEAILSAGSALGEVKVVRLGDHVEPHKQFMIVPEGYREVPIDVESLCMAPFRNKGVVEVVTVDSFNLFVQRENLPGSTVCFANQDVGSFKTIFNFAEDGDHPGWADRYVTLSLKETTSWERWLNKNKVRMDQLAFADFVDENMGDIVEPDAATIIEMIQQLKVHRKAEFTSVVDPRTGFTNITFNEQTSGETLKGNIEFCGKFVIGLKPFRGSDKYRVDVSLRFSIDAGNKLLVFFSLINADLVEETAFDVERAKVLAAMTELGVPVFDV